MPENENGENGNGNGNGNPHEDCCCKISHMSRGEFGQYVAMCDGKVMLISSPDGGQTFTSRQVADFGD